ncbi:MAG TPA: hypothetical protein VH640_17455 [Bryobacteraceae bacterium]|jgi:hypothetical protein
MEFLSTFARDVKVELPAIMQLYRDTRDAEFVFGEEILKYIEQVAKTAHEYRVVNLDKAIMSGDVAKIQRSNELEEWLVNQVFKEAKEKFGRYLKLTEPEAD